MKGKKHTDRNFLYNPRFDSVKEIKTNSGRFAF